MCATERMDNANTETVCGFQATFPLPSVGWKVGLKVTCPFRQVRHGIFAANVIAVKTLGKAQRQIVARGKRTKPAARAKPHPSAA